jgi:hypothetical protein
MAAFSELIIRNHGFLAAFADRKAQFRIIKTKVPRVQKWGYFGIFGECGSM